MKHVSGEAGRIERGRRSIVANQLQEGIYDEFGRISIDAQRISELLLLFYNSALDAGPDGALRPLRLNRQFCYSSALQQSIFGRLIRLHFGGRLD
jgi:hypothetical protein